jgi:hypothetical protein
VLDLPAPPDQDPDLALDLARDAAQIRRQLGRRDFPGTEPAPVNAFQRVLLAGLEPRDIAADDVQGAEVSTDGDNLPMLRDSATASSSLRSKAMTAAATLFGIAVVGTIFWLVSPEAAVAVFAARERWNPVVVGLVAGGGQAVSLTLLFLFGDQLRRRWRWFDGKCERVRTRFGARLSRNAIVVASTSGLLGFPPVSVAATLAPALAPRPALLLPLMVLLRVVRLTLLAALAASTLGGWPW